MQNQKGVTLIELLTATIASSILLLIIATLMYQMNLNFVASLEKIKIEEDFAMAELQLRAVFNQAINVTAIPAGTAITTFDYNLGTLRDQYDLSSWTQSSGSGSLDTLAVFLRDMLPSGHNSALAIQMNTTGINQRFLATALFFQRPTTDRFGVLYIHESTSRATPLAPTYRDTRIERIVDFKILATTKVKFQSFMNDGNTEDGLIDQEMLSSVTLQITQRYYFNKTAGLQPERWCPPLQMISTPSCQTNAPYNDLTRLYHFNLRNNVLGYSVSQKDGNTPLYRRVFDQIYFLKPTLPGGMLSR